MTKITIKASERAIILGKTGSGKSEFAKHMLRIISKSMKVVIIDPKEDWLGEAPIWAEKKEEGTVDKPWLVDSFNPKYNVQILQPDVDDKEDTRLDRMCFDILSHRNVFVYFDETDGMADAHTMPRGVRRIWKTGRSKNIGAWVGTQVPTGIPRLFKTQAEKWFVFKLPGMDDPKVVQDFIHTPASIISELPQYHYLYYDSPTMDTSELMPPVPYKGKK